MSDSPQEPSSTMLRRIGLNSLPTEVKAHIAQICAEQDATLIKKLEQLTELSEAVAHYCKVDPTTALGSLFRASKEWATICAPFRFTNINLERLRKPFFRMSLAHSRGEHFTEIDLRDASLDDLVIFVGALPLLPNLRTIHAGDFRSASASGNAYTPLEMDATERACMIAAMRELLGRAHRIGLDKVRPYDVSAIIGTDVLARLRDLQLVFSNCFNLRSIDKLLSSLGALQRLDIQFAPSIAQVDAELSLRPARQPGDTFPALRSLRVVTPDIAPSVLQFVSQFAPSLEELELRIDQYDIDYEPQDPTGITGLIGPFPRLQKLTLEGDNDALDGPLASMDGTTMPVLRELTYKPHMLFGDGSRREREPAMPALSRDSPIDCILVYPQDGRLDGLADADISRVPARELCTPDDFYTDTLAYSRSSRMGTQDVEFEDVEAAVSSTIEFLSGWLERATIHKDTASLVKMARALCQVELERIAYEA